MAPFVMVARAVLLFGSCRKTGRAAKKALLHVVLHTWSDFLPRDQSAMSGCGMPVLPFVASSYL